MKESGKAWQGRIAGRTDPVFERFNRSLETDLEMALCDIEQTRAWSAALERAGVLDGDEVAAIGAALDTVAGEVERGEGIFLPSDEDIHMAVERRVTEITGKAGEKLQTGRSRNDQVLTDLRMYLMGRLKEAGLAIRGLQQALLERAATSEAISMPGYTHLQPAQILSLAHYLLSMFWALERDRERIAGCLDRLATLPLGSGALAGSGFPVDRELLRERLGFLRLSPNSVDAVSDRDFAAETAFVLAQAMVHLSRYAEDWIMWSSPAYGFLELDDSLSTGSSLMPQKKNPDPLELIRGKAAAAVAVSAQLLILQKGLPTSYQKDLQEDKPLLFRLIGDAVLSFEVFRRVVTTVTFDESRMRAAIGDELYATDLADHLVHLGIPFRKAHEIVGTLVRRSAETATALSKLPLEVYAAASEHLAGGVGHLFSPEASRARRDLPGGTGPASVAAQLARAREVLGG